MLHLFIKLRAIFLCLKQSGFCLLYLPTAHVKLILEILTEILQLLPLFPALCCLYLQAMILLDNSFARILSKIAVQLFLQESIDQAVIFFPADPFDTILLMFMMEPL